MVTIKMAVRNLERSVKFYKEVLGYRDETLETDAIKLAFGKEEISLEEVKTFEKAYPKFKEELVKSQCGVGVTIGLHVQDANQAFGKVESYGGKVTMPIFATPSGNPIFACRDPDGYLLRVHSHAEEHGHSH